MAPGHKRIVAAEERGEGCGGLYDSCGAGFGDLYRADVEVGGELEGALVGEAVEDSAWWFVKVVPSKSGKLDLEEDPEFVASVDFLEQILTGVGCLMEHERVIVRDGGTTGAGGDTGKDCVENRGPLAGGIELRCAGETIDARGKFRRRWINFVTH